MGKKNNYCAILFWDGWTQTISTEQNETHEKKNNTEIKHPKGYWPFAICTLRDPCCRIHTHTHTTDTLSGAAQSVVGGGEHTIKTLRGMWMFVVRTTRTERSPYESLHEHKLSTEWLSVAVGKRSYVCVSIYLFELQTSHKARHKWPDPILGTVIPNIIRSIILQ